MAKTQKKPFPKTAPPLHVELSDDGNADLLAIRTERSWNKKTAVENSLRFYRQNGGRIDFGAAGKAGGK